MEKKLDPLPFSNIKSICLKFIAVLICFFDVSTCYARTDIIDLKEPGEVKLNSGNVVNFEKLCIDGYVYLYFKQQNTGNDGLTQIFITDFRGQKVPQQCIMLKEER